MAPTITSARSPHSTLACILLLFFAMVPISVHAQTYDLRVGTERYYNENGISNWFYGPHTGIRDFPVYHFESVIDETTISDTLWAVVAINRFQSFFSPLENRVITSVYRDTVYQRLEDERLIELNRDGSRAILMDFNVNMGDSVDVVLEQYTHPGLLAQLRNDDIRPVVFADTTILFPDQALRRIVYGDMISSSQFPNYSFDLTMTEFIALFEVSPILNMPLPPIDRIGFFAPYFYVEGAGVMFSMFSQRPGLVLTGYKPVDAPMIGLFETAPTPTTAPETPKFNFPRQIGNVWVYSTAMSQGCADRACVDMRLALIDEIEVDGMSCSIFDLDHIKHRYSRTFTWCFEDDKILWPRTDIDPDTNRVDLVADFSLEEGGKWLLSNQLDPNAYYHVVRELYHISESGSTYSFNTYGTDNLETLEYVADMKFVDHETYHIGLFMEFRNDVGLFRYTHSMDGSSDSVLKGSYIDGVLAGDTTFYYITSIDYEPGLPTEFELGAYPNPFNPTTQIRFTLPMESQVELGVYTVTGRRIATLVNEVRLPGTHQVTFDASDLASGVYIYRIRAGDFMQSGKMTLVK